MGRRRIGSKGIATLCAWLVLVICVGQSAAAGEPRWADDQLLVRSMPRREAAARTLLTLEGARAEREFASLGVSVVRTPAGRRGAVQRRLRSSGLFRFVERNYLADVAEVPNDPLFPSQWALERVQAPVVWDLSRGAGVTVAIVDSGIDPAHADLAPRLLGGYNAISGGDDSADDNGHGTRMAGIAAASGFDAFGVIGAAPESSLLPVKVLGATGSGTYSDIAEGIVWAVDHGAHVVSLSLGGGVSSFTLSSAVDYATSRGVVVVAAGGNSGIGAPSYPAGYADVIAVGASDAADARASFSNFGSWIDVLAPGVGVLTTNRGGGFSESSGTSPATPLVAAAAALVLSVNPALQPAQVASILDLTADDLGAPGFDPYNGWGRLQVANAVSHAAALAQQPDTAAPAATWIAPEDGAAVQGVVELVVDVFDDVGVVRVDYAVDGVVVAVSSTPPFAAQWDSASTVAGAHLLSATAYDASGNRDTTNAVSVSVGGPPPGCRSPGFVCLPGGGPARTDCYAEWLVRADAAASAPREKGRAVCTDGAACDADGAVDGKCSFSVGLCFASADDRLVDRHGAPACDTEDLSGFSLLAPGYRRTAVDSTDAGNVRALLMSVSALSTGLPQGRCASGARGRECADDLGCDSSAGASDGVCGLELTSLAGVGGVEACTALQELRVPLKLKAGGWRKGVRTFKSLTRALPEADRGQLRDADVLKLECHPAQ